MAAPLMGLEDVPTTGAQTWPRENPVTYGSGPFDRHEAVTRKVVPPALKPRFKFSSAARAYLPFYRRRIRHPEIGGIRPMHVLDGLGHFSPP